MRLTILFLFLFPLPFFGQNKLEYAMPLIPAELLKDANAVVRRQEIIFNVKSPGEATLHEMRVVTLLNDESDYDRLVIFYDNFNKLGKIKGKVYDAMGNFVREIGKGEIKDVSAISGFSIYEDNRARYVDINYAEYPYTVEFEYEKTFTDLLDYPNWEVQEFYTSVENGSFYMSLPAGTNVHYKALNMELSPKEEMAGGRRRLTWAVKNLPAVISEPYCPPAAEVLPQVLFSPEVFEAENYTGSMSSWKDFGSFVNLLMKDRDVLSPAMKEKVRELTAHASSDTEKIEILYHYLQENMRYVSVQLGIGGWQPFDATYVEQNKYGDCKALSNFMKSLLKEAGIEAYPVLIKSGELSFEVTEDFATPAFNHMMLHVPSCGQWLECTSNTYPAGYIGWNSAGRNVLLITEKGGQFARTPDMPPSANFEGNQVSISLLADGRATVEVRSNRKGYKHEWLRWAVKNYSQEDFRKEFQENSSLSSFMLESLAVQPQKDAPEATVEYKADVARYASKSGKRLFVPLNTVNPFTDVPPANENRIHPILVREGYSEKDDIEIRLPEGYSVESFPSEPVLLETEYGRFSVRVTVENDLVRCERELEIKPVRLPAEQYNSWRDFCKEIAKTDGVKLVLVEKKT